jgi:predicted nucleotidyltransferase
MPQTRQAPAFLKLFFLAICACTSQAAPAHSFNSPEEFFAQDYAFFNKYFYKIDPFYYESSLENPLNLSPDFMLACLTHLYEKRANIVCDFTTDSRGKIKLAQNNPLQDHTIDAIITACWSIAGLQAKFLALKKSIQEYGSRFKQVHIFVGDAQHASLCEQLLAYLFTEKDQLPPINFIITNRQSEIYIQGLKLLKLSDTLSPAYIIIEDTHYLADKYVTESKNIFSGSSICLGAHIFPIKDPLLEAKLHGYDKIYPDYNDLICAWFHSALNFYVRTLHYNLTHKEHVHLTEYYVAKKIRQKDESHDLEKSYYFSKLGKLHLQKSPLAANRAASYLELLRALGTLIYAKEIYAPNSKPDNNKYQLDQQITILKENVLLEFSKNGLSTLCDQSHLTAVYQKELEGLCHNIREKLHALNTGSRENISDNTCAGNTHVINNASNTSISNTGVSNPALFDIYHEISVAREALLKQIIADALEVVGTPLCKFALVAYGSTARKEATPHSDIEFGIIVEKNSPEIQDYFEKLAAVVIYKLIDLGKTPVSFLNIASLNSASLSSPSLNSPSPFLDFVIPAGLSPDGFNLKLPIAESRGSAFFGTIPEVIHKSQGKKHCFSTTKLLCGDTNLFAEYLAEKQKNPAHLKKLVKVALESEVPPFSQVVLESSGQPDSISLVDIKTTFYRPFISTLEFFDAFFGFNASSSHERIELLYTYGHITEQERQELQKFWQDILLFRLKMHMQNQQRYGNYRSSDQEFVDRLLDSKKRVDTIFKAIFSKAQ